MATAISRVMTTLDQVFVPADQRFQVPFPAFLEGMAVMVNCVLERVVVYFYPEETGEKLLVRKGQILVDPSSLKFISKGEVLLRREESARVGREHYRQNRLEAKQTLAKATTLPTCSCTASSEDQCQRVAPLRIVVDEDNVANCQLFVAMQEPVTSSPPDKETVVVVESSPQQEETAESQLKEMITIALNEPDLQQRIALHIEVLEILGKHRELKQLERRLSQYLESQ